MSSAIPGIKLYDYQGGYRNARPLDPDAALRIRQTEYSPGFVVNGPTNESDTDRYLQMHLSTNQNLGQVKQTAQPSLNTLTNFGSNAYTANTNLTYESLTAAYDEFVSRLSVSESNYDSLVQQGQFNIYNGRAGLAVETNGVDTITRVALEPGSKSLRNGEVWDTALPDRSTITERAASVQGNTLPAQNNNTLQPLPPGPAFKNKPVGAIDQQAVNRIQPDLNPFRSNRVGQREAFELPALNLNRETTNNPILQALLRRQPLEVDTSVIGPDAQITPQGARQLGAVRASVGVEYSDTMKENLVLLRERLAQEHQTLTPRQLTFAREGTMPAVPYTPQGEAAAAFQSFMGGASTGMEQMGTSADTTEKKSSGGYIPFNLGGGGSSSGGETGSQMHQRQQRRAPLYALA